MVYLYCWQTANKTFKGGVILVNENLLKAKIIEKGIDKKVIAEKLGISPTSLNYKMNNKTEFKASEIQLLSKILGISREKDKYFFA